MKMLRWGYALVVGLVFVGGGLAVTPVSAAIYTAELNATWRVTEFTGPGGVSVTPPVYGLSVLGNGQADASRTRIIDLLDGSASATSSGNVYDELAETILPGPVQLDLSKVISLNALADGNALVPGALASSEAAALGEITLFNGTSNLLGGFTIGLKLDYDYALTSAVSSGSEDASAMFSIAIDDFNAAGDHVGTIWSTSASVSGSMQDVQRGLFFEYPVLLLPLETRTLRVDAYVMGSAAFQSLPPDNGGGGPGGNNDPNAVPEPSTIAIWSLFGIVGLTVGAIRRRRK